MAMSPGVPHMGYTYLSLLDSPELLQILFGLCLFRFVGFLFLLGSEKGCGLWFWHSLDFSLTIFNYRNKALTAKPLRQGYRYFKLRKAFSKFDRRHSALVEKYSVSLKTLQQQGISEPEFYGDLVYRCLSVCHFVLVFFNPFSIAITSLGEERANLGALRTFVRFVLVWICRFPLPLGVWEGLRFVVVALPGLFSYLFLEKL